MAPIVISPCVMSTGCIDMGGLFKAIMEAAATHLNFFGVSMFKIFLHDGVDHFLQLLLIQFWSHSGIYRVSLMDNNETYVNDDCMTTGHTHHKTTTER